MNIELDEMMTPERAAVWLGISARELAEKRRKKQIPAIELGERTVRYHPRTVITKLALDAGVIAQDHSGDVQHNAGLLNQLWIDAPVCR